MRRQPSLARKLTLIVTSLVVVAVGTTTALSVYREQQNFRSELEQQANVLLDTLEIALRDSLYRLEADRLQDFMDTLGQYQGLVTVGNVYDGQGRLLADVSQERAYEMEADPLGQKLVNTSNTLVEWHAEEVLVGRAIVVGKQPIGAIQLGLSTVPLQQKIIAVRNRGIGIAVLAAVVGAILAQWVSRSITKPVKELVQGTKQIAQGNFDRPIRVHTKDELLVLANAFNKMGRKLKQTLSLLGQKNQALEIRTEELTQTLQELQETHAQLIQSEKMSSLGQLVAGIAHEINNPVTFIHGNLQYIDEYTEDILALAHLYQAHYTDTNPEIEAKLDAIDLPFLEEDLAKVLKSMRVGTERIREIVLSLRNFSRTEEADRKLADVHEGIDSTLMILQHRLKANSKRPAIQIEKDYGEIPQIACYPGQLNQVFMNILANAIDALEERNDRCRDEDKTIAPGAIQIRTWVSQPQRIAIAFQDNGAGMPEIVRAKLFNPFFTTKPVGKGTGLGLSISYRIITEGHDGKLSCESAPGQGTTFIVELPICGPTNPLNQADDVWKTISPKTT